jgi:hypothetical protein
VGAVTITPAGVLAGVDVDVGAGVGVGTGPWWIALLPEALSPPDKLPLPTRPWLGGAAAGPWLSSVSGFSVRVMSPVLVVVSVVWPFRNRLIQSVSSETVVDDMNSLRENWKAPDEDLENIC